MFHNMLVGRLNYQVTVLENTKPGSFVMKVNATDPDGIDNRIKFAFDAGAKDNFVIDKTTGDIRVSRDAVLDIQENGEIYEIQNRVNTRQSIPLICVR